MTKTLVAMAIAVIAFSTAATNANAGWFKKFSEKDSAYFCESIAVETCRRYFCKTKKVFGRHKTFRFVEITYSTPNNDAGPRRVWKKIYRS